MTKKKVITTNGLLQVIGRYSDIKYYKLMIILDDGVTIQKHKTLQSSSSSPTSTELELSPVVAIELLLLQCATSCDRAHQAGIIGYQNIQQQQ